MPPMAAKQLCFESEARGHIKAGVAKLAAAVKATLGPRRRNAVAARYGTAIRLMRRGTAGTRPKASPTHLWRR